MAESKIPKYKPNDTGWQNVLSSGAIAVRKIEEMVSLRLATTSATLTTNGVLLATLDAQYRPSTQRDFAGTSLGGTEEVWFRIETNGQIKGFANPQTKYWSGSFTYIK